ncbi:MAG: histidine--tRNA ligase [Acetobacteraceae bacterium]|nr:histidine--tRNA ligase [Acetobacteraceae bacterium]
MTLFQPPRGTRDLIGEEQRRHAHVVATARRVAQTYGFDEWATPVFEDTRVFARSLGDTSDVVTKEMYTFEDRGGESVTLRPENTAGVCRALVSNGLAQSLPQRVFYAGPMFRYERPQKGRFRQFHQVGAELLGPAEPLADAEVIALGRDVLDALGVAEFCPLELNTLGDAASRAAWRGALVAYLRDHRERLSRESVERLERNPLRVLDSKDPADKAVVAGAPLIGHYLTPDAARFWDGLRESLGRLGVAFTENPRIVRGLDYYNHTAFEFVTDQLGAQGTVLGGGRYDGLVEQMGGPSVPGVGWAAGVERLAMLLTEPPPVPTTVAVIPVSEAEEGAALDALRMLRRAGIRAEMGYRGNLRRRMERANRIGARAAIIIGSAEAERGTAQLRDLATGEQTEMPLAELPGRLA